MKAIESVWDYPRPPQCDHFEGKIQVVVEGECIVDAPGCYRVLETSHPPTFYISKQYIRTDLLRQNLYQSFCEWKGLAYYYDVLVGSKIINNACWCYPKPKVGYETITDHLSFYPSKMDACFVDGERVTAQAGDFYGGWITDNLKGPFKGGPGTTGW